MKKILTRLNTLIIILVLLGGLAQPTTNASAAVIAFTNIAALYGLGTEHVTGGVFADGSNVYAATTGGLSISTDGGATFTSKTTANGLGAKSVRGVFASGAIVYAATTGGLSISTDSGATFTNKTTTDGLGDNAVIGVFASGSTVYAATAGGLSISTDSGATFTNRTTTNGLGNNSVIDVFASGSTIYAATNGGLSISTDSGATFTNKTTTDGLGHNRVRGVYTVGATVYAATDGGVSISTDSGATFTNKLGTQVNDVYAVGSTVYAATNAGGLFISTDSGATFTNKTIADGLGSNQLYGAYAVGSAVYAATQNGLSISTDSGASFTTDSYTPSIGLGDNELHGVFASGSTVYAATHNGLSISTDSGATFINKTTTDGLGNNIVYSVFASGSTVYAATEGGLSISTDSGVTFINKTTTDGLGDNLLLSVFVSGSTVYAATVNGLSISTDSGATFANKTTADGLGDNVVSGVFAVGSTVCAATNGGLSISTDSGATFSNKTTADGLGNNIVHGVYVDGSTLYAATEAGLSISTDGGTTFTNKTTTDGLGNDVVRGVFASGSTVYAGTDGGLSISTDSGATFTNKTTADGLGSNFVNSVYDSGSALYVGTDYRLSIAYTTHPGPDFIVNTDADTDDGTCDVSSCTLREAIDAANANADASEITFAGDYTITLGSTLPQIATEMTIDGSGYTITIDGGDSVQLFYVASTGNFTVNQATLQNGFATEGGAIHNHSGTLTVTNSTFTGNDATDSLWEGGGAIYNFTDGLATVSDSTFDNNSATNGGAIYNAFFRTTLIVTNSTFSNNVANDNGGAIHTGPYNTTLIVSNSTFTNNSATDGGAISHDGDNNTNVTTINNSTFSDNSASRDGGAIYKSYGMVMVSNSTFSSNSAPNTGGIRVGRPNGALTVTNSTFSGNLGGSIRGFTPHMAGNIFAAGATGNNCTIIDAVTDNGYNLSDDASCGFIGTSVDSATLNLGALANNGGPTQTHLPGAGSAAIGAIPNGTTINNNGVTLACNQTTTDQRGELRPLNSSGDCTAGAVEVSSTTYVLYLSSEDTASINGLAYADEDIIAYDPADGSWAMYFDGSDVNITDDIYGFSLLEDGSILMAFKNPVNVPGVGSVTRSDVVQFFPASLGETTSGTFALVFDGSDVGLTAAIDAVGVTADGRLILSTTGSWSVPATGGGSISGADEDLIVFNATSLGATTAGDFELLYDGSDVDMSSENTNGVWLDTTTGDLYLTTTGDFSVTGLSGKDEDIFRFVPTSLGSNTAGSYDPDLFFDGSTVGYTRRVTGFAINADQPLLAITPPPAGDEADLSIILVEDNDPVTVGDAIRYSVTVHNNGPDAAQNVQVVISLDSKVLLQSVSSSVGTCSGTTTVTCSLGTLVNGAGATITLDTKAIAAGTAVHTATISSDTLDPTVGNNSEGEDTLINSGGSSSTGNIIYLSTTGSGGVGGVRYEDEDILAYYPDSNTWVLFFDGSLQGFTRDINAFHITDNGSIYMSFDGEVTIPDVGAVTRQDIVFYDATTGIFSLFFDGSAHDLTSSSENIDGLWVSSVLPIFAVSTTGEAKVNGSSLVAQREDVMLFDMSTGVWTMGVDNSKVGNTVDVDALFHTGSDFYFSLNGSFSAVGAERRDVFILHATALGDNTAGTFGPGLFFDASAVGFSGDIDGLHVTMNP